MTTEEVHVINISHEVSESEFSEMISISIICRLCANQSDKLIGIYSEDGVSNDLEGKLNLYLPIKVSETDNLPLQCCWQCASTVLAWHDLVITSVEADRRLRSYHFITEKQLEDITTSYDTADDILTNPSDEVMVAADSIRSHTTINYETINTAELLVEDSSSQMEEQIKKTEEVDLESASSVSSVDNAYISVRKEVAINEIEINLNPQTPLVKEEPLGISKTETINESDCESESAYKFECLYCPTLFIAREDVLEHMRKEHRDAEQAVFGDDFGDNIEDSKYVKDGEAQEEGVKKKPPQRSFHVRHMTKHPLPKINQEEVKKAIVEVDGRVFYKCRECGKSLHSVYTYVWHSRIHTGERPYVCNLCNKQFRVSQGLVRHLKETHEKIKNFDCDICGRLFATKRNVEEHRRIHTNERPYVCATCGKAFKQKASLFVHNRSHSSEFPFSCTECRQKFRTRTSMQVHLTKHTGEKPFPCDVCGRKFRIKYELKRHKLIHSEDKPFTCKICTQAFRQKRYLRNHLKLNHNMANPAELLEEYSNAI